MSVSNSVLTLWVTISSLLLGARLSAQEFAYIANFRSGTLSVLGTDSDAVSTTMPLAEAGLTPIQLVPGAETTNNAVVGLAIGGPVAVAVARDGTLAYVVQTGSPGALIVVDTEARKVLATIPLALESFALGLRPDGKEAYVANFGSDNLSVIDTVRRQVIATVPVGHGPSGVAVSEDGARAYVTNLHTNTVSIVDLGTRTVRGELAVGQAPFGLAMSGQRLLVANSGADSVAVIRTQDQQLTATIPVGKSPAMIVITSDGRRAYVSNQGSDSVSVVDIGTAQVTATISVGRQPFGLALGTDHKLLVTNRSADTVSVVDTRSNTMLRTVTVGSTPFGIALAQPPSRAGCQCSMKPQSGHSGWGAAVFALPLVLAISRFLWRRLPAAAAAGAGFLVRVKRRQST